VVAYTSAFIQKDARNSHFTQYSWYIQKHAHNTKVTSLSNCWYPAELAQLLGLLRGDDQRIPTAEAHIRAQVRSCGICGGQSGTGAGIFRVLRFPLPILIAPTASHSSSIIGGWCTRPISSRRTEWTQSHPTPRD
jgi:hypothetical protein